MPMPPSFSPFARRSRMPAISVSLATFSTQRRSRMARPNASQTEIPRWSRSSRRCARTPSWWRRRSSAPVPCAAWRRYQAATGITPASRSSVVVTPSNACMRSAGIDWPCACRSMKPGATTSPVASITCSAPPRPVPTAAIRPSSTATSPTASMPLAGSTTRPPLITKPPMSSLRIYQPALSGRLQAASARSAGHWHVGAANRGGISRTRNCRFRRCGALQQTDSLRHHRHLNPGTTGWTRSTGW